MSADIAIRIRGLGKKYTIGGPQERYLTFRDALVNSVKAPFRRFIQKDADPSTNEFWALKDVSFDVHKGEVIGIIGKNGAGKSTLLKILSRITTPTEGEVDIYGRVGSLLEVGTGFHPELTGRENVFLSGSILGMKKTEIEQKFDEIVKFSEIEKFIDTPVKRYSSGMYVRLAFAVAAHLDPEILIIDEVLAVGDVTFQKKCLSKMGNVAKEGRTVLFVSHNMAAIQRLCHTAVLLEKGQVSANDEVDRVVNQYLQTCCAQNMFWNRTDLSDKEAYIESILITDENDQKNTVLTANSKICVTINFVIQKELPYLRLAVVVFNYLGDALFSSAPDDSGESTPDRCGRYQAIIQFPADIFLAKTYGITVSLYIPGKQGLDMVENIKFSLEEIDHWTNKNIIGSRMGHITIRCKWKMTSV